MNSFSMDAFLGENGQPERIGDIAKRFTFIPKTRRGFEKGDIYISPFPHIQMPVTQQHQLWNVPSEYPQQRLPESPYGGDSRYWTDLVDYEDLPVELGERIPSKEVESRTERLIAASEIHRLIPMVTLPKGREVTDIFTPQGKIVGLEGLGIARPLRLRPAPEIPREAYGLGQVWGEKATAEMAEQLLVEEMLPVIHDFTNKVRTVMSHYAPTLRGLEQEEITKIIEEAIEPMIPEIAERIAERIIERIKARPARC